MSVLFVFFSFLAAYGRHPQTLTRSVQRIPLNTLHSDNYQAHTSYYNKTVGRKLMAEEKSVEDTQVFEHNLKE